MIDFPASPVVGQTFAAPNGVTYQWNGTAWITAGQTVAGGGDFFATRSNQTVNPGSTVINGFTVLNGNSGTWFNAATGRFTPPAGRYYLFAGHSFYSSASLLIAGVVILKNGGGTGPTMNSTSTAANNWGECSVSGTFDANGTDYFEMACTGHVAASGNTFFFGGYPTSGMKGPPGDVGTAATGDFSAKNSADMSAPVAPAVMKPNVILSGNSGNWYNPASGRYTPPAGRYYIAAHASYLSAGGASTGYLQLYKNGVGLIYSYGVSNATGYADATSLSGTFDANGTDYFEVWAGGGAGGTLYGSMFLFSAFPIAGLRGPQGPPGTNGTNGTDGAPGVPGAGGDLPVGSVVDFAGATAPVGWLICNGQLVSRTTFSALFAAIGTLYGAGDGTTTFGVPDLGGRTTAGREATATRLSFSTTVGAVGGHQNLTAHTHGPGSFAAPDHLHTAGSITTPSHAHNITGGNSTPASYTSRAGQGDGGNVYDWTIGYAAAMTNYGATGASDRGLGIVGASASAGAGNAENVQPTMIMHKIIKA